MKPEPIVLSDEREGQPQLLSVYLNNHL